MTTVTVRVPAKINLQLAVGPLRPDGYHDLVTVFHAISLYDEISVSHADADSVTVSGEGAAQVPADADNLALRAVSALRAVTGPAGPPPRYRRERELGGVAVTISKRIPVAAGLAGGSADAAAALVACNELWRAGLGQQDLCEVAAEVGSDVAFAVLGGTAVGRGRGERLTPALMPATQYHWVLALADGYLSTPQVYGTLDRMRVGRDAPARPDRRAPRSRAEYRRDGGAAVRRSGRARPLAQQRPAGPGRRDVPRAAQDPRRRPGVRRARRAGFRIGPACFFLARSARHATDLAVSLSGAGVCRSVVRAAGRRPVPP